MLVVHRTLLDSRLSPADQGLLSTLTPACRGRGLRTRSLLHRKVLTISCVLLSTGWEKCWPRCCRGPVIHSRDHVAGPGGDADPECEGWFVLAANGPRAVVKSEI